MHDCMHEHPKKFAFVMHVARCNACHVIVAPVHAWTRTMNVLYVISVSVRMRLWYVCMHLGVQCGVRCMHAAYACARNVCNVCNVCRHACMHVCMHACMQCMYVCMYVCMQCMYVCMYACM